MVVEKFLEKFEANSTSVMKETAARLIRISEKGLMKERRRMVRIVILQSVSRMNYEKYGEILAITSQEKSNNSAIHFESIKT